MGAEMMGGPGRRRVFDGGELRLVLLRLIADAPRHGYELIRAIEELTHGAYAPSPGIVYPTLTLLDDMELVEEQKTEGARKQFSVTAAGLTHLADRAEEVAALMARLQEMGEARAKPQTASIRRAMVNLRTVLMHKFARGDMSTERLHEIVAMVDDLAQQIERLD
ncbi:MAG: PadR family transcriptional regulator [Sphingomonas sp.]